MADVLARILLAIIVAILCGLAFHLSPFQGGALGFGLGITFGVCSTPR